MLMTTPAQREAATAALLVARAKAGEPQAFDALVLRYRKRIFAIALHLSGSESDADDIVQDVFIRAYSSGRCIPRRRAASVRFPCDRERASVMSARSFDSRFLRRSRSLTARFGPDIPTPRSSTPSTSADDMTHARSKAWRSSRTFPGQS